MPGSSSRTHGCVKKESFVGAELERQMWANAMSGRTAILEGFIMVEASSRCAVADSYHPPASTCDVPSGGFAALLRGLADRWERARAIRDLNRLSDRYLRDIGIAARGDIETIADAMIRRRRRR
jgi:uncharacterized protein YjiS (DUF1127 family)